MTRSIFSRLSALLLLCGFLLYSYVDKNNRITQLKIAIPNIAKQVQNLKEKNMQLQYEIDQFESPQNLISLARQKEFSHLKFPSLTDVLMVSEGLALNVAEKPAKENKVISQPKLALGSIDAKALHPGL